MNQVLIAVLLIGGIFLYMVVKLILFAVVMELIIIVKNRKKILT